MPNSWNLEHSQSVHREGSEGRGVISLRDLSNGFAVIKRYEMIFQLSRRGELWERETHSLDIGNHSFAIIAGYNYSCKLWLWLSRSRRARYHAMLMSAVVTLWPHKEVLWSVSPSLSVSLSLVYGTLWTACRTLAMFAFYGVQGIKIIT